MLRTKTLALTLGFAALAFIAAAEFTSRSCYDADSGAIDTACRDTVEILLNMQVYLLLAIGVLLLALSVRGVLWVLGRMKSAKT